MEKIDKNYEFKSQVNRKFFTANILDPSLSHKGDSLLARLQASLFHSFAY